MWEKAKYFSNPHFCTKQLYCSVVLLHKLLIVLRQRHLLIQFEFYMCSVIIHYISRLMLSGLLLTALFPGNYCWPVRRSFCLDRWQLDHLHPLLPVPCFYCCWGPPRHQIKRETNSSLGNHIWQQYPNCHRFEPLKFGHIIKIYLLMIIPTIFIIWKDSIYISPTHHLPDKLFVYLKQA